MNGYVLHPFLVTELVLFINEVSVVDGFAGDSFQKITIDVDFIIINAGLFKEKVQESLDQRL